MTLGMGYGSLPNLAPGELLEYDYRTDSTAPEHPTSLKVLQWNVERNYKSREIIENLKELDPDVIVLQEVDIGCKRSGKRNHMQDLCKELGVRGGFVCEFIELDHLCRKLQDEGGGYHGNAILSKYDITFRVLHHKHHAFNWDKDGEKLREPRKGRRYTLVGTICAPSLPPVLLYCVHLEVFTGIVGRVSSFSEIFNDASLQAGIIPYQAIFGDLNTMAHSIARLSPSYACDYYRILSLGSTESEWWDEKVFGFHYDDGPENTRLCKAFFSWLPFADLLQRWTGVRNGFDPDILAMARNPGFYDPWDPNFVTLHNPNYCGIFKGKLDWTLLRNFAVTEHWYGNTDYTASDHVYLMVRIVPDKMSSPEQQYQLWLNRRNALYHTPRPRFFLGTVFAVAVALVSVTLRSLFSAVDR